MIKDKILLNFNMLLEIMEALRDKENGCEWNKDQNSMTIRNYCIEEAYEVVDAIEGSDIDLLKEELGDLLFQVVFHSQINKEKGNFDIDDVLDSINKKMTNRHPHVFDKRSIKNKDDVELSWRKIKEKERLKKNGRQKGILSDIPTAFPAMTRSNKIQKRASENGFDWDENIKVFNKIKEEISELEIAIKSQHKNDIKEEIGDLLFSIINLSRKFRIDPEESLRLTNNKFIKRIEFIENELLKQNKIFKNTKLGDLEELWEKAKKY